MPQVPRYDSPRVRSEGLPGVRLNVRASPDTFGASVGQAAAQIGGEIYEREVQKADEIAVTAASRRLTQWHNALLYDPNNGALTKKGRDSFSAPEEVIGSFDKKSSEISSELNDRQRRVFQRRVESLRGELDLTVQRHVFQERQRYDEEETNGFIASERDAATGSYNDARRVTLSIENQKSTISEFARRNGKSPDWVKNRVQDAESKTHLAVIERALASGDDRYAKAYYEEVKKEVVGQEAVQAAKLVQDGTHQGESQRIVDKWVAESPTGAIHPDNRGLIQKEIAKIEDPKLRDMVQVRTDQYFARMEAIIRDNQRTSFDTAIQLADQGQSVPVTVLQQLTGEQVTALRSYEKSRARGVPVDTDWELYHRLFTMALDKPGEFRKHDLLQYKAKLDDAEFKQLLSLQGSIDKKDDSFDKKIDGYRTTKQVVDDSLAGVGIDPTPKPGSSASKEIATFRTQVDRWYMQFESQNKRKPNAQEVQEYVDSQLIKGKVPGSGWFINDTRFRFQLEPNETLRPRKVADIPKTEIEKIRSAFSRKNGRQPTDAEIIDLFSQKILMEQAR